MMRLLEAFGVKPDMVVGHSLGEYAACVAANVMPFADALYAVSARGREMAGVKVDDNGKMAFVASDVDSVEKIISTVDGYIIAANKNCHTQTVIAGATKSIEDALTKFATEGIEAKEIPVSHAFHSEIVAPASKPLANVLQNLNISKPSIPVISNVEAMVYPETKEGIVELLRRQLESPVEFIAQIEKLYANGARIFVEVGPRRAVTGFVRNILGDKDYIALATNHPKKNGLNTFLEQLAALVVEE